MFPEFSQESVFWLFGIFVGIFVVTLIIIKLLFSDAAKAKRALRKVPRVKVKDMRLHQTVRVVGKVRYADEPLIAPLSKRPCTFFEVMVEEGRAKGNRVVWEDIFCSTRGRNFFIEDETGRAHVKFEDVEVVINKDSDSHSTWLKKAPENFEAFLNEHGMSSKGRRLEAKEGVLEEGETIVILGRATTEADNVDEADADSVTDPINVLKAPFDQQMRISDETHLVNLA